MVRNAAVETEKKTRTIKAALQSASRGRHTRKLMGTIGGKSSIKIFILGISFQYDENNSMLAESIKEYSLVSAEADY